MELSIFLAKTWGVYTLIAFVVLLIKKKEFKKLIQNLDNGMFYLYGGFLSLGIGIPHVIGHSIWTMDFRSVVTLLGWASLVKGIFLLLIPKASKKMANTLVASGFYQMLLFVYLLIGVYLTYVGFTA